TIASASLPERTRAGAPSGSGPHRPPVAAPVRERLVGHARMVGAVGQPRARVAAAEEEIGAARIADWPAAGALWQLTGRAPRAHRYDVVDDLRLRLGLVFVRMRQRGVPAQRRPRDPYHRLRPRLALPRRRRRRRLGAT